jgi:hypothetical protein
MPLFQTVQAGIAPNSPAPVVPKGYPAGIARLMCRSKDNELRNQDTPVPPPVHGIDTDIFQQANAKQFLEQIATAIDKLFN